MDIQNLENKDISLLVELQPEGWNDIMPIIDFYTKSSFCFPIKIISNNKIIGIGSTIIHNDVSWLGHIIVHPEYRNKGIGKLITQALVNKAKEKNCTTIYLIATDLGEPVYKKVGFEEETEYLFFKDLKNNGNISISKNIIEFNSSFKSQIINLDKEISGENRVFQIDPHLKDAYVYKNENDIEGFYLPTFGEGLILANNSFSGVELMKFRLKTQDNVAFPVDNIKATEFMYQNNFKEFKKAKRMILGKKRLWQPQNIYNRIAGNFG